MLLSGVIYLPPSQFFCPHFSVWPLPPWHTFQSHIHDLLNAVTLLSSSLHFSLSPFSHTVLLLICNLKEKIAFTDCLDAGLLSRIRATPLAVWGGDKGKEEARKSVEWESPHWYLDKLQQRWEGDKERWRHKMEEWGDGLGGRQLKVMRGVGGGLMSHFQEQQGYGMVLTYSDSLSLT